MDLTINRLNCSYRPSAKDRTRGMTPARLARIADRRLADQLDAALARHLPDDRRLIFLRRLDSSLRLDWRALVSDRRFARTWAERMARDIAAALEVPASADPDLVVFEDKAAFYAALVKSRLADDGTHEWYFRDLNPQDDSSAEAVIAQALSDPEIDPDRLSAALVQAGIGDAPEHPLLQDRGPNLAPDPAAENLLALLDPAKQQILLELLLIAFPDWLHRLLQSVGHPTSADLSRLTPASHASLVRAALEEGAQAPALWQRLLLFNAARRQSPSGLASSDDDPALLVILGAGLWQRLSRRPVAAFPTGTGMGQLLEIVGRQRTGTGLAGQTLSHRLLQVLGFMKAEGLLGVFGAAELRRWLQDRPLPALSWLDRGILLPGLLDLAEPAPQEFDLGAELARLVSHLGLLPGDAGPSTMARIRALAAAHSRPGAKDSAGRIVALLLELQARSLLRPLGVSDLAPLTERAKTVSLPGLDPAVLARGIERLCRNFAEEPGRPDSTLVQETLLLAAHLGLLPSGAAAGAELRDAAQRLARSRPLGANSRTDEALDLLAALWREQRLSPLAEADLARRLALMPRQICPSLRRDLLRRELPGLARLDDHGATRRAVLRQTLDQLERLGLLRAGNRPDAQARLENHLANLARSETRSEPGLLVLMICKALGRWALLAEPRGKALADLPAALQGPNFRDLNRALLSASLADLAIDDETAGTPPPHASALITLVADLAQSLALAIPGGRTQLEARVTALLPDAAASSPVTPSVDWLLGCLHELKRQGALIAPAGAPRWSGSLPSSAALDRLDRQALNGGLRAFLDSFEPKAIPWHLADRQRLRAVAEALARLLGQGIVVLETAPSGIATTGMQLYAGLARQAPRLSTTSEAASLIDYCVARIRHLGDKRAPGDHRPPPREALEALGDDLARSLDQALERARHQSRRPTSAGWQACPGAGLFRLLRTILELRLPALCRQAPFPNDLGDPFAALLPPLLAAVAGQDWIDGDRIEDGLAPLCGLEAGTGAAPFLDAWGATADGASEEFQAALLELLADQRILQPGPLHLWSLPHPTTGAAVLIGGFSTPQIWPLGRVLSGRPDEAAQCIESWLELYRRAFDRAPRQLVLDRDLAPRWRAPRGTRLRRPTRGKHQKAKAALSDALDSFKGPARLSSQAELSLSLAAMTLLRAWARWLKGFDSASLPFLLTELIRKPGWIRRPDDETLEVMIEAGGLDLLLELSGYRAPIERVPWLADRRIVFVPPSGPEGPS